MADPVVSSSGSRGRLSSYTAPSEISVASAKALTAAITGHFLADPYGIPSHRSVHHDLANSNSDSGSLVAGWPQLLKSPHIMIA